MLTDKYTGSVESYYIAVVIDAQCSGVWVGWIDVVIVEWLQLHRRGIRQHNNALILNNIEILTDEDTQNVH